MATNSREGPQAGCKRVPHDQATADADLLRNGLPSMLAYLTVGGVVGTFPPQAYRENRDQMLRDLGNPSDPVEVMMVEQLINAHLHIGLLAYRGGAADSAEAAAVYWGASSRLMGEFRRTALALQQFRSAAASQQSVRTKHEPELPMLEQTPTHTELVTKEDPRTDGPDGIIRISAHAEERQGATDLAQQPALHGRAPRKAAAGGNG